MKKKEAGNRDIGVRFNESGEEIPDNTPVVLPVGGRVPNNWKTHITQLVRKALNERAEETGHETFEEANDFDCPEEDDELDPTQYEENFDHEENFLADVENANARNYDRLKKKESEIGKGKQATRKDRKKKTDPEFNGSEPSPKDEVGSLEVDSETEVAQSAT